MADLLERVLVALFSGFLFIPQVPVLIPAQLSSDIDQLVRGIPHSANLMLSLPKGLQNVLLSYCLNCVCWRRVLAKPQFWPRQGLKFAIGT